MITRRGTLLVTRFGTNEHPEFRVYVRPDQSVRSERYGIPTWYALNCDWHNEVVYYDSGCYTADDRVSSDIEKCTVDAYVP
jgi:hypothetical protein